MPKTEYLADEVDSLFHLGYNSIKKRDIKVDGDSH